MTAGRVTDDRVEPDSQGPSDGEPVEPNARRRALIALALLLPAPTLGVLAYMWWIPGTALGGAVYGGSKIWMSLLPLVWLLAVDRRPISLSPIADRRGLLVGTILGGATLAVIVGAYLVLGDRLIDPASIQAKARENRLDSLVNYVALAAYLTAVNSLIEEYVWRWFVFEKCCHLVGRWGAVVASASFFTIHHIFALKAQFGWSVTILGSLGTFVGGASWSWCYLRYRSIWPGYIAHVFADIAVLAVGWRLIFA